MFLEEAGGKVVHHGLFMQLALRDRKFKELRQHIPTHYLRVLVLPTRTELTYHQLVYSHLSRRTRDRMRKGKPVWPHLLHQLLHAQGH